MTARIRIAGVLIAASLLMLSAAGALADSASGKRLAPAGANTVHGGAADLAKTVTDTVLLMGPWGSGALENGQFQSPEGAAAWNGWTSIDLTQITESQWHADTYGALDGTMSAWCGDLAYAPCSETDPEGGYGNNWNEILEWRGTVANPGTDCTVDISALVQSDTEPGFDYCFVTAVRANDEIDLWLREGEYAPETISLQTTYTPGDYAGENGDEVVIQFRFTSDGGWSDADCSFSSDGAFRVDNLSIGLSNGTGYSHDFEDGTLGDLQVVFPQGVGDFAKIWTGLDTPGNCGDANLSPMVGFIDDGEVVPGTGGTLCVNHCYGPDGFVVNYSGGLAGPDWHIHNAVESPVMPWPGPEYEGCTLEFDVWRDMLLGWNDPGIFFTWSIRTTSDPDPATIADAEWVDRNFVHYGGPDWMRMVQVIGDLVPVDAQWIQVQLAVYEIGFVWGFVGDDSSPAPLYDNVRLSAYPYHGPSLTATVNDLPHDAFPESGELDLVDLGANNIRFDSGQDISDWSDLRNDPGDSVIVDVKPLREGATLVGLPRLQYSLKRNPLFDPYRTAGLPDRGFVEGWQVYNSIGNPIVGRFAFDLPDSGFLYPGDFLYYYFEATDIAGGIEQTATLPADTTGFSDFDDPMAFPPIYKLHALPTLTDAGGGQFTQPGILFWDDAGAEGNRDEWYMSFRNLGLIAGEHYDIYYTNNPRFGTGQGLGGRATADQLAGYDELLYTAGLVTAQTINDGTSGNGDDSLDVQVLTAWLEQGGKDLFVCGDDVAGDLSRSGSATWAFLQDWMGATLLDENVLEMIDLQTGPLVIAEAANPVLVEALEWRGVARCPTIAQYYGQGSSSTGLKRYDGVVSSANGQRLAQFAAPNGSIGVYDYNAATLGMKPGYDSRVVSLPYDLAGVWTDGGSQKLSPASLSARTLLLKDVLAYFGVPASGYEPSPVPDAGVFSTSLYPNPFNPVTTIKWNLPRAGHLSVQVFDVRGRVVRTLVDEAAAAGPGQVQWDGRGNDGRAEAAGMYFYRLQSGSESRVGKMSLIK